MQIREGLKSSHRRISLVAQVQSALSHQLCHIIMIITTHLNANSIVNPEKASPQSDQPRLIPIFSSVNALFPYDIGFADRSLSPRLWQTKIDFN